MLTSSARFRFFEILSLPCSADLAIVSKINEELVLARVLYDSFVFCTIPSPMLMAPHHFIGPPTERHSVAAVVVSRGSNDELFPAELSGFARVQQAVGKKAVIATAPSVTASATVASRDLSSTAVVESENCAPRDSRRSADGVRYVTLQFHSVSSRG